MQVWCRSTGACGNELYLFATNIFSWKALENSNILQQWPSIWLSNERGKRIVHLGEWSFLDFNSLTNWQYKSLRFLLQYKYSIPFPYSFPDSCFHVACTHVVVIYSFMSTISRSLSNIFNTWWWPSLIYLVNLPVLSQPKYSEVIALT